LCALARYLRDNSTGKLSVGKTWIQLSQFYRNKQQTVDLYATANQIFQKFDEI